MEEEVEKWQKISSEKVADCRVFQVRKDFSETANGAKKSSFFVIENPDWVNVIAVNKENQVVLIEQFRHGIAENVLEIPGGMIDDDEEPLFAAKRELLEETGYSSAKWLCLGKSSPNPAIQNNTIFHFLALDAEKNEETSFDEHENVVTKLYNIGEVGKLIKEDKFIHSLAITAFYYYELYRKI